MLRPASLLLAVLALAPAAAPALAQQRAPTDTFALAKRTFLANQVDAAYALFAAASRARPEDPDRHAWYAESARRLREATTALHEAREALRLAPCHAFAHEVVANLYNPQFQDMDELSSDTTWLHLNESVRCDETNGSAWMGLWIEGLRRNDEATSRRAMAGLRASGLITAPWLTHGRWVLSTLPPRAIALSAGDVDTYPPEIVQALDGMRPDVAIVNTSMLNLDFVVLELERKYALPLPPDLPRDSLKYASGRIISYWREQAAAGRLDRPLVLLHSVGEEFLAKGAGSPTLAGPFWTIGSSTAKTGKSDKADKADKADTAAIAAAFRAAEALDWHGPAVSPNDRSPIRNSYAMAPALMVGYLASYEKQAVGHVPGRADWLEAFFTRAETSAASTEQLMRSLRSTPKP